MSSFRFLRLNRWLHRRGVSRPRLRGGRLHRWFGEHLLDKEVWLFHSESVARGWLIGSIVTLLPLPGQSLIAATLSVFCRANLPLAFAMQFLSNPATALLYLPFCYGLGCWILGKPFGNLPENHRELAQLFQHGMLPLCLGAVVAGLLVGLSGYLLIRWVWPQPKASRSSVQTKSPSHSI